MSNNCQRFCDACGDCIDCYGEDECYYTKDGKHIYIELQNEEYKMKNTK